MSAAAPSDPRPLAGRRLLVVEDEALVATLMEELLTDLGCAAVDVAGTLAHGLELVAYAPLSFDGAVLDVNLGGETVFPLAERLQSHAIPFLFVTGYGVSGVAKAFADAPVLRKPLRAQALERALSALLPAT